MALVSCTGTKYVTKHRILKPPETLLKPCNDVEIKYKYSTNGELILNLIEISTEYNICKQQVSSLIDFYNLTDSIYSAENYIEEK